MADGTFENRKTFAFIDTNIPDGKTLHHLDADSPWTIVAN
jgi:hypothetical protein